MQNVNNYIHNSYMTVICTSQAVFWLLGAQHLYMKRNYTLQRGPLKLIDFNPSIDK